MFIGCKDDDVASGSFDPSQPVEFKDFSPKEGQVRTRLYIYGKNFGTDETKIHVNVGGKEAKIHLLCLELCRGYFRVFMCLQGSCGCCYTDCFCQIYYL